MDTLKRMMLSKGLLSLLTVYFTVSFSIAQPSINGKAEKKYRAVHWGVDDGLGKERWHNAMIKDANEFMWFGSNHGELSRFDGNSFKRYYPEKSKRGTIRSDKCLAMVEDSLHNLWIGTPLGLSRYDSKADTFTNFPAHTDSKTSDASAVPLWATPNEVLCIEAGNQITRYDVRSFKTTRLVNIGPADKVGLATPAVSYAIYDVQSNSVWMLPEGEEGLVQYSLSLRRRIFHPRVAYTKADAWRHTDAEAMCYDRKRNCIWINSHDGLTQFTLRDQKFHQIEAIAPIVNLKGYARMVGIDIDPKGRIWLATIPKGMLIYDPSTRSVSEPFPDAATQNELAEGNLKIYCDRDGMVWISYFIFKEIYEVIPFTPPVYSYLANPNDPDSLSSVHISNIIEGESGQVWIGTFDGLNIFEPRTGSFSVFREKDLPGIKGQSIIPMLIESLKKKAWLNAGPPEGVYEMDLRTRKCKLVTFRDSAGQIIKPQSVINYLSVPYKNGLLFFDNGSGIFEINDDGISAKLVIPFKKNIFRMTISEGRTLFLKTFPRNVTYCNVNGKWTKKSHPFDRMDWDDIFYDRINKTYWLTAGGEIIHYDKDLHVMRRYTDADGLLRGILSIIPDAKGNIWFNNDRKSVGNLNIHTGVATTLSEQDGYQKQWYDLFTAPIRRSGKDIYIAGNNLATGISLDRIMPEKFANAPARSLVYIKALKINERDAHFSIADSALSLRYFENKIDIETGIIDYFARGKTHIRYKLEGLTNWLYAPGNSTIHYAQLPVGNFRLVMQASNTRNEFNGPERTLSLHISPAFWNSWWFRLFAVAIASFIIVSIFRARISKIRNDAFIKTQLKELEMKALKAQMNPHFIYNALNSIQALVANDKKTEGIHYIGSFSRLLRQVLDNSENSVISLDKELETIDLYIQLESLRLDMQLHYKKIIPENVVPEFEKIPPLILQPFVENALWHGLNRKEGEKEIKIAISLDAEWLICDITDNGIGREKSTEFKKNSAAIHQSKGLDITLKRLIDFNETDKVIPIEFFDLHDSDKNSAGTRVIVRVKRKSNFPGE